MNKKIAFDFRRGVKKDVREELKRIAKKLPEISEVSRSIQVTVVPHPAVKCPDGIGFGCCRLPDGKRGKILIYIAAGLAEICQEEGGDTREEAIEYVSRTFLHEFAHYEQWRDGKTVQERGVNLRAKNLLKKLSARSESLV